MFEILLLLGLPALVAGAVFLITNATMRAAVIKGGAFLIALTTLFVFAQYFQTGIRVQLPVKYGVNMLVFALDILLAGYFAWQGMRSRNPLIFAFAVAQAGLLIWFEATVGSNIVIEADFVFDQLTGIMILIIGIIGSLICWYSVSYMKYYHKKHTDYADRSAFFLSMMFIFLAAMFGLVLANNLLLLYFCWEVTTLCSFLLIGYTKTEEARKNSLLALAINLGGGLSFALGMVLCGVWFQTLELSTFLSVANVKGIAAIPVFLFCLAGLTKSAQFPFCSWLLGAMAAPTPSSALLHSSTMVKAGVYLIIRLSPLLTFSSVGVVVSLIGCITFLICAIQAIAQTDAKKILAYSTLSNLGLIVLCAAVGTQASVWAAILLVIFHAVSKSVLFLTVGSVENQTGNRDVEQEDNLTQVSGRFSVYLIIGIVGMFLAPFGMLISKWIAMKAFLDSNHILAVAVIAYGSAVTLFFWAKWLGKIVAKAGMGNEEQKKFIFDEEMPIFLQAILVILSCFGFPLISYYAVVPFLSQAYGYEAVLPLGESDVQIMFFMLSILLLLPFSIIPFYKNGRRRHVTTYMGGENIGDNTAFFTAMGQKQVVMARNWYLENFFNALKLGFYSNVLASGVLVAGAIFVLKGW